MVRRTSSWRAGAEGAGGSNGEGFDAAFRSDLDCGGVGELTLIYEKFVIFCGLPSS
jgi:hypothetical protein